MPEHNTPNNSPSPAWSVGEVAQRLGLKTVVVGGKTEHHGANPTGNGATKNGFILFDNGTAWDRKDDLKYTSADVARLAGLEPNDFEPCRTWRETNPRQTNFNPSGPRPASTPGAGRANVKAPGAGDSNASAAQTATKRAFPWDAAQTFDYVDENGVLLFQIGRIDFKDDKDFRQRRPDDHGGWIYKLGDVRRVVFGLPDVINAETVLYCEGEKTAIAINDHLKTAGLYGEFVATTHNGGAKGLRETHAQSLHNKNVTVLPDNDVPGREMAERLCQMLVGNVPSLKSLDLPNLPIKGDAVDYFAGGGSIEGILSAAAGTPEWTPSAAPKPPRTATGPPRGAAPDAPAAPEPGEPTQPRKKRFPIAPLAEVLSRPDPTYLIRSLLVDGGTSLFTAKHASFKSFVCLDMTLCVSIGRPWHGFAAKRGTVIYVAAEGAAGLKKRALAWFHHHNLPVPDNYFVLDMPLKIADARVLHEFIEQVAELSPAFIILDTLGRCAVGLNENDPSAMGIFIDAAGQLAATTNAHVMVVHHNNKSGEYRGASSLPAGVDTHLSAERSGDTVTLKTEKQKDDDELEPLVFEKIVVPIPGSGGLKTSLVFRRVPTGQGTQFSISEAERKVLMALAETFGVSGGASSHWKQAAEECGIKGATFYRCQTRLLDMGAVKVVRGERGKHGAIYVGNGNWPNPPEGEETARDGDGEVAASAPVQMNLEDAEAASQSENSDATDETEPPPNTAEPTAKTVEPVEAVSESDATVESDAVSEGDTSDEGEVF